MQRIPTFTSLSAIPVSFKDTVHLFKNQSNQGIMKTCLSFWYSSNNNKILYFKGFVILLPLSSISPLYVQNLVLFSPRTITGTANVTIESGEVLTVDDVLTVNHQMTVENGGVMTYSQRL